MMTASVKDDLRSFRRSWVHHTGMQLATLTVLSATFTIIIFVFSLSLNLKNILASWGESVQLSVYLLDEADEKDISRIRDSLQAFADVERVSFVPREAATDNFRKQMAGYAPDLLTDADFANPFPASFRVALKGGVHTAEDVKRLEMIAGQIGEISGVEDVTYGQSWVQNYSSFVTALSTSGGVIVFILLAGSLFVIGNSIRVSIAARREEIEILELVGATSKMIRRPYIFEGLMMGFLAAALGLVMNFGLHFWQSSIMSSSLAFARLAAQIKFFDLVTLLGIVLAGSALGALGAWLTIRKINDGWSASHRMEI